MDAYIINLEERKDRWNYIQNTLKEFKFNIQRVNALKGNLSMNASPFVKACLQYKQYCSKYHIESFGALGCMASHRKCWSIIKDTQKNSFIFEDDANPAVQAKEKLNHVIQLMNDNFYDIIFLGSHETINTSLKTWKPWTEGGKLLTGSWAYILSPKAASTLIDQSEIFDLSVDIFLQTTGLRYAYVPCFTQTFFLHGPDIQHLDEKLYSKNQLYFYIILICIFNCFVTYFILKK